MRERVGLLDRHRKFFTAYRARFAEVFLKVCKILNAQVVEDQVHFLRQGALEIYDHLFCTTGRCGGSLRELEEKLEDMEEHGVSINVVLTKSFSVMTHDFVDYAAKTGNVVAPVRVLTGIMTACLTLIDTMEESPAASAIDEDEGGILEQFDANSDQMVHLETLYQGVPIQHEAMFITVGEQGATFQLGDSRETLFEFHEEVLIHAPFLEKPVLAKVEEVDRKRREVVLTGFHFSGHAAASRAELRVQPDEPIQAVLKVRSFETEGLVMDISVSGLSLSLDDPGEVKEKDWLHLEMVLPGATDGEKLITSGEVARISQRKNSFRVGVLLKNTPKMEHILSEYVTRRQAEVIRQVQASTRDETYVPVLPRERPWVKWVSAAGLVVVMGLMAMAIFYGQPTPEKRDLDWKATGVWLSKHKECQRLSDIATQKPTGRNIHLYERCTDELEMIGRDR